MADPVPVQIVLVEDDEGHAVLIERNLRRAGIVNEMVTLGDGQAALDFFLRMNEAAADRPVLVLLDLNLPVMDGIQVLKALKGDERTRSTPVIVLTSSDNPREVERCYALGCNIFITKPVEYEQFSEAIGKLGLFLSVVKVPPLHG